MKKKKLSEISSILDMISSIRNNNEEKNLQQEENNEIKISLKNASIDSCLRITDFHFNREVQIR